MGIKNKKPAPWGGEVFYRPERVRRNCLPLYYEVIKEMLYYLEKSSCDPEGGVIALYSYFPFGVLKFDHGAVPSYYFYAVWEITLPVMDYPYYRTVPVPLKADSVNGVGYRVVQLVTLYKNH